jgi:hypothetical protein
MGVSRREHVMRRALTDARGALAHRAGHRPSEDVVAEVGRAVTGDDVTGAIAASERAQAVDRAGAGPDDQAGEPRMPRTRTATVDDIRRELSRSDPDDGR